MFCSFGIYFGYINLKRLGKKLIAGIVLLCTLFFKSYKCKNKTLILFLIVFYYYLIKIDKFILFEEKAGFKIFLK